MTALLLGILITSVAYSLTSSSVIIGNSGHISSSEVTALSGSAPDVQAAVNSVAAAGGGTVRIPAGNFTFNINGSRIGVDNQPYGVQVPGGVNVIGVGNNQTILYCPITGWDSGVNNPYAWRMFCLNGANNKPIRISGILFQGSINYTGVSTGVAGENANLVAIVENGVRNFRIDHCTFIDFTNAAIYTTNNFVSNPSGNCGVIDHCIIDNPYKDVYHNYTGVFPLWAYGIVVGGNGWNTGAWRPYTEVFGNYEHDITYIEDCSFRRCRHCVAEAGSGSEGFAVIRYCNVTDNILEYYASFLDVHPGGRGYEVYNCTLTDVLADYRSFNVGDPDIGHYYNRGCFPCGGSGLIYNNTIVNCRTGIGLTDENQNINSTWWINGWWIWDNTMINVYEPYNFDTGHPGPILQEQQYFLHAPNASQFTYTAMAYPFPFSQYGISNTSP
jgi:hypothetical protein